VPAETQHRPRPPRPPGRVRADPGPAGRHFGAGSRTITEGSSFARGSRPDSLALIRAGRGASKRSLASAAWVFGSTTRTSRTSARCRDAVDYVVAKLGAGLTQLPWTTPTRGRTVWPGRSVTSSPTRPSCGQALAHRSWCGEQDGAPSNERLEFLGDAVLGLVVAEHSYRTYPDFPEGKLAQGPLGRRQRPGSSPRSPRSSRIGDVLLARKGEEASGGRTKPSILADAWRPYRGGLSRRPMGRRRAPRSGPAHRPGGAGGGRA